MLGGNPLGGAPDISKEALSRSLDAASKSRLLSPDAPNKSEEGCAVVSRKSFAILMSVFVVGMVVLNSNIVPQPQDAKAPLNYYTAGLHRVLMSFKTVPKQHRTETRPNNYTMALHKALMFFNAQRSGKLPKHNNVSWRGDSCTKDGLPDTMFKDLSGGYYDAGDPIKFHFPKAFAITMLSWSVIEYSAKYEAAGELAHIKDIIKWGTDYFLKTFNNTADSIDTLTYQVGSGLGSLSSDSENDHYCWMRPEDINYERPVSQSGSCSDLACEMAAALASASIVFKDDRPYSQKLVNGAKTLYMFGRRNRGRYSAGNEASIFYNSSGYYDEYLWGGAWLFYATGNTTYLQLVTKPAMAKHAGAFWSDNSYKVLSWDNKLFGAQVLLTRLRLFLDPGYPYRDILHIFHQQTGQTMCSFLPFSTAFNRTKGGLIMLNNGRPQVLQYVANTAYLAALYSDYLEATETPGWYCGKDFISTDELRRFAKTQMDYILGNNPMKMSYVVGFGRQYPQQVHHRGASIPNNKVHYSCTGGFKWRDSKKPNPNTIVGAMVGGPDRNDGFQDIRRNYNYTEPTIAGNAGLVAALVALSGNKNLGIDKNTIFSVVPSKLPSLSPPPAPWKP